MQQPFCSSLQYASTADFSCFAGKLDKFQWITFVGVIFACTLTIVFKALLSLTEIYRQLDVCDCVYLSNH